MFRLSIFLGLFFFLQMSAKAQDERYFRKMLSGEVGKDEIFKDKEIAKMKVATRNYRLDLGGDAQREGLIYQKRDGQDWFYIANAQGKELYSFKLDAMYADSSLFKINFRDISPRTKLLILHFYEGKNDYVGFDGRARIYFITVDDKDLSKVTFYKGPEVWHEYAGHRDHYHQRFYDTDLIDLNGDGIQEVRVRHNKNQWVYMYSDFGKWAAF